MVAIHKSELQENPAEIMQSWPASTPLHCALPDGIEVKRTNRKSPSGDRLMVVTYKQYIPERHRQKSDGHAGYRERKPYITKEKAGETAEVPSFLPVVTNREYQGAMSFRENSNAFLQPLPDGSRIKYRNGLLFLGGLPATYANIKNDLTEESIGNINLPLLMVLYGILLHRFSTSSKRNCLNGTATVYYPDLAKKLGKPNPGVKDIKAVTSAMEKLKNIVGIVNGGSTASDILPVLSDYRYDKNTNTISFASPYITRVINEIDKASVQTDKKGNPVLDKNGMVQKLPAYSYLIDISIEKERNKKAVEIVMIIVALIEQAERNTPHIRARTVIERACLLGSSLRGQPTGSKNTILKRAFSKAWELLRSRTSLSSIYKDIQLPDPEDPAYIPTCSTLDMVFRFPHAGKDSEI